MVNSTPRPHFTPGKDPVPVLQSVGWAPGPVWTGGKFRPHRDSIPDRPTRSSVAIPTELPGPYTYIYVCVCVCVYTRIHTYFCMSLSLVLSPRLVLMCRFNFYDLENLYFFPVCEIFIKLRKFLNRRVTSTKRKK